SPRVLAQVTLFQENSSHFLAGITERLPPAHVCRNALEPATRRQTFPSYSTLSRTTCGPSRNRAVRQTTLSSSPVPCQANKPCSPTKEAPGPRSCAKSAPHFQRPMALPPK